MGWFKQDSDDDDESELDTDSLECPVCGCNAVEIIRMPKDNWFGGGLARCLACPREFPIRFDGPPAQVVPPRGGGPAYLVSKQAAVDAGILPPSVLKKKTD